MKVISLFFLLLAFFFAGCATATHDHGGGAQVEVLVESSKSWDGATLPSYPDEAPYVSILKITIPPHSQLAWHKHPCINAGYLLSGEILVTSEIGQTRILKAGEGLVEMVNTWHYGRNNGDVPAVIVVVYSGVEGQPLAIIKED